MRAKKRSGATMNSQLRDMFVQNILLERQLWIKTQLDPRRDIDQECGHPEFIDIKDYLKLFKRGDVAKRVVSVWPEESWSERPQIYETEDPQVTEFEKSWKDLEDEFALYPLMQRADILSGVGRFGVILLGFDDGGDIESPLPGVGPDATPGKAKLIYTRTFEESAVTITNIEQDDKNPRYGLPTMYQIGFQDTAIGTSTDASSQLPAMRKKVHWSRIIHLADNLMNSEIFGMPRMQVVFNRLLDMRKIAGGSGEMFWKGGFPGLSLETLPEVIAQGANVELDIASAKKQLESYMNGLQRYIATVGLRANSLKVEVADPSGHIDAQLKLLATALGIPWRVFVGSEAAQLASEQDIRSWNRRLNRRRTEYLSPYVILPLVKRLIQAGALPKPKAGPYVSWPDLNTPSDKDKAAVAQSRSEALAKYVATGVSQVIPPFHFLTLILQLSDEEAKAVVDESFKLLDDATLLPSDYVSGPQRSIAPPPQQAQPGPQGGNGNGTGSPPLAS